MLVLNPAGFPQGNDSKNDSIYAAMHFIDRWFPSKNGRKMSHQSTLSKHVPIFFFRLTFMHGQALYRGKIAI